jgi:hypothetical protein
MALNANALVTLNVAKDYLEIPLANTAQDTRIERHINAASQMFERWTSRKLKRQTHTEQHDGKGSNTIMLLEWPCVKPSRVCVDSAWTFAVGDDVQSTEFDVFGEGTLVLRSSTFPRGTRNVLVTYLAGYDPVPADLEEACLLMIDFLYSHRNDRRSGVKAKTKNGETVTYIDGIPTNVALLLEPYKRMDFAGSQTAVRNG